MNNFRQQKTIVVPGTHFRVDNGILMRVFICDPVYRLPDGVLGKVHNGILPKKSGFDAGNAALTSLT
jgi:hypothetical protein